MTHTDQEHSVSFSYGVSDNLTLLARGSFHVLQRETFDGAMSSIVRVNAEAFGDTEVGAIYNVYRAGPYRLDMQVGATIPTGETLTFATVAGVSEALPYDMRPGTGAFGVVAGIGGGVQNEVASVGGQFKMWTPVLDEGTFQRGRTFEGNGWVAYAFNQHLSGSAGVRWRTWDHNSSADARLAPVIADDPGNSGSTIGGQRAMLPVGFNFRIPEGSALGGHRLSLEAVYALHHDYEGPQFGLDWGLNVGWTVAF
jgi:hypothetical protein